MKTALVTGASSGIGEATAKLLDSKGWRVVLVARREDRLRDLAAALGESSYVASDLTDDDAPARVREHVEGIGELHLLVNNAGRGGHYAFGDPENGGWKLIHDVMALNFDAVVRLTDELLPTLRASAPSSIVNVGSVAGRVGRPKTSAYSASKFALAGWSECLHFEEKPNGVHVALVLPGFISTEGFPQEQLTSNLRTRWIVSTPEKAAKAVLRAAGGKPEVHVPRPWAAVPRLRSMAGGLWYRARG